MVTGQEIEALCLYFRVSSPYNLIFLTKVFPWCLYRILMKNTKPWKRFLIFKILRLFFMNLSLPFLSKLSGFLLSFINIWLSCYQFLFIWILTRVVNFLSWMSEFSNCQLKLRLSTGIYQKNEVLWYFMAVFTL